MSGSYSAHFRTDVRTPHGPAVLMFRRDAVNCCPELCRTKHTRFALTIRSRMHFVAVCAFPDFNNRNTLCVVLFTACLRGTYSPPYTFCTAVHILAAVSAPASIRYHLMKAFSWEKSCELSFYQEKFAILCKLFVLHKFLLILNLFV